MFLCREQELADPEDLYSQNWFMALLDMAALFFLPLREVRYIDLRISG